MCSRVWLPFILFYNLVCWLLRFGLYFNLIRFILLSMVRLAYKKNERRRNREKKVIFKFVENIFGAKGIRYLCQILLIYAFSVINGIDEFLVCYLIFNVFTLTIRKIGLCGWNAFALCANGERVSVCLGFSVAFRWSEKSTKFIFEWRLWGKRRYFVCDP